MRALKFSDKVAVVAGAGGGIGLNVARDLIAAGACVLLADMKPVPDDIAAGPGRHNYRQGDLTDDSFVRDVVGAAVKEFGRLDYLVNTAGVLWFDRDKSLVDIDLDVWDEVISNNLKSFMLTARYAIPAMRDTGGGAMLHFSSIDALRGDSAPQDAYGASKAAVIRLSKSIAIQYARDGIRSNAILPGPVLSPMQARWDGRDDLQAALTEQIPLGRIGATQDLANACLFLLSDEAGFITGTELIVDGGISAAP
ncbi:MAG: SDR family oxidoreductase [Gammaproteobacteria bacterium]|nr:SDR family oxidoreductase [Gammaproteobacteria bacterium]